jgi:hypothetical protein
MWTAPATFSPRTNSAQRRFRVSYNHSNQHFWNFAFLEDLKDTSLQINQKKYQKKYPFVLKQALKIYQLFQE